MQSTKCPPLFCPQCGNNDTAQIFKAGKRETPEGVQLQRYLCRNCGSRFSEVNPYKLTATTNAASQVCVSIPQEKTKNLDLKAIVEKAIAGEKTTGLTTRLIEYAWTEKKRQLRDSTITQRVITLNLLQKRGANLDDPDSVLTVLSTENFTEASKFHYIQAYLSYTKTFNIPFDKPKIQYEPKEQYTPKTYEVETLIQNLSKQQRALCQTLAETGARVGEISRLQWNEVDAIGQIIYINHPEKHSKPRKLHVSELCISLIMKQPKKFGNNVFNPDKHCLQSSFARQRNRIAEKLDMPNLKNIHHHSFRRFFADQQYKKTKFNIRKVQARLGHKRLSSTEKYFGDVDTENVTYETARAYTVEEQEELRRLGYELYDTGIDKDGRTVKLYSRLT